MGPSRGSLFGAVAVACAAVCTGLTDQQRQCDLNICDTGRVLQMSCGGNGDVISEIEFASFGKPVGECPASDLDDYAEGSANLNVTDCHVANSQAVASAACLDEEECTIDVGELFAGATIDPSCASVAADLNMTVLIICGPPGLEAFDIAIALVIVFIGLGLGATIEFHMIKEIFVKHKRALIVGVACQFGFMPLMSLFWVKILGIDDLLAVGMLLVGSCPGGVTSNLFTYWAKGSVALSITMSAFSTFCAIGMLPLLLFIYVDVILDVQGVETPFADIMQTLVLAIFPALIGMYIRGKSEKYAKYAEVIGSGLGGVFILGALIIGILENPDLFDPSKFPNLWIAAVMYQPIGCAAGLAAATVARLPRPERRAVSIEVGVQNFTLAIAIATLSFSGCERRDILSFPLIATFWYLAHSVLIVGCFRFWAKHDPVTDEDNSKSVPQRPLCT